MDVPSKMLFQMFSNVLMNTIDNDDEDDDEELVLLKSIVENPRRALPLCRKMFNHKDEFIPSFDDTAFKTQFRMKQSTFNYILDMIIPSLVRQGGKGRHRVIPEKQLMICLCKMTSTSSYRTICEKFNVGLSTALRSVRSVIKAIYQLESEIISWPKGLKVKEIINGFAAIKSFPNVIGTIGGTHININAPAENSQHSGGSNTKGRQSIKLQAVVDHKQRFMHCFLDDIESLNEYFGSKWTFPQSSHLLGDVDYPLHPNLMTPYLDNNGILSDMQENYNECHSKSRMPVDFAFQLLKGRFRSLLTVLDMHRIELITEFIIACCVVHNICIMQNDTVDIDDFGDARKEALTIGDQNNHEGIDKRNNICINLAMLNE